LLPQADDRDKSRSWSAASIVVEQVLAQRVAAVFAAEATAPL
jgi:hypothetical protein